MIGGKVRVGTKLFFDCNLSASVLEVNEDGSRVVEFFQDDKKLDFLELVDILNKIGHLPLPPYMNRDDEKQDEQDYQTLFAKNYGAVAAPTASLHFTPELLEKINVKYDVNYLTLHVGAGTFKPVDVDDILNHPMHSEYFEIGIDAKKALDKAQKVLAVGTTVTRTVEYYARTNKIQGECDLFLNPANKPIKVDYLLTNFHLPKSTLIMLVASFVGLEKTLEIYQEAIKENYRFYSYGDGMLII
jgi:S-adenosylmethionine:tRNA ribosyltransferase-isomerase